MRIATLSLACSALFFAACSNDNNAASACTTAAPSGGPAFVGAVSFGYFTASTGTDYSVDASLYPNFGEAALNAQAACPGTQVGSCCYMPAGETCALPMGASAGDITVSKDGQGFGSLTFTGGYYNDLDSSATPFSWQPGDVLSVSAPGATAMAPSFTGAVVAPSDLANLSPAISGTLTIPATSDFVLTWTPGAGTATVQLFFEDVSLAGISCSAPVTSGTVTVPAALLKMLGATGSVALSTVASASATSSGAAIYLRAFGTSLVANVNYTGN